MRTHNSNKSNIIISVTDVFQTYRSRLLVYTVYVAELNHCVDIIPFEKTHIASLCRQRCGDAR